MRCKTNPNMIGVRFCRLVAIAKGEHSSSKFHTWLCKCDCGTIKEIRDQCLRNYKQISCGCYAKEKVKTASTKHNACHTRLYRIYTGMKQRCNDKNHVAYQLLHIL